jgi:K+-sensing histidine kinase KdpD
LATHYPQQLGVRILKDFGLVESVFMPMRYGGKVLGTFEFHAKETGRFSDAQLPLFRNVADQVAVAVANILANEEIQEREREKQQLLLISNDLANVRTREDFWPVLNRRIAHVFGESDTATLYLLKPDGRLFFAAQHKHEDFILNHPLLVAAQGPDGSLGRGRHAFRADFGGRWRLHRNGHAVDSALPLPSGGWKCAGWSRSSS